MTVPFSPVPVAEPSTLFRTRPASPVSDTSPRPDPHAPSPGTGSGRPLDALDLDSLTQMVEALDPDTAVALVDGFVAEMLDRAARLAAAAETGDVETLARDGHALKSSAGTYGARDLHGLASSIERSAKAGDRERAIADARQAPAAARRAAEGFAAWKAGLDTAGG